MIQYTKRNIQRERKRNNELILGNYNGSSASSTYGGADTIINKLDGNYLPAKKNADGTYLVDLEKVTFNGSVIANKELSCWGEGTSEPLPTINVINNLLSDSTTDALSAFQGKVLKNLIDNIPTGGTEVDLTNYYTKGDVNNLLNGKSDTGHTHSQYLTEHQSLANYYTKGDVNGLLDKKSNTGHTHNKIQDAYDGRDTTFAYSQNCLDIATTKYLAAWNNSELRAIDLNKFWTVNNFTSTNVSNWNSAASNSHSHSNKGVLDGITSTNVSNWNTAFNLRHSHSNKSVIDGISSGNITNWNSAASASHSHSNKSVLDGIKSTDITNWNGKLNKSTWDSYFYESNGSLHSKKSFVSDGELTCYSDKRLKSNIKPLENKGYVEPKIFTKDNKEQIGFLAQDVQEKYPQLVTEDENGYLMLNYSQYTAVLQSQIIDLQQQINELKKLIDNGISK